MLAEELHSTLKKVEKKQGTEIVRLKDKEVRKFCELIHDTGYDGKFIPPGYIMNLTNRVIQKIFLEIGPLFISKIRGLIHVNSKVEFHEVMPLDKEYKISIETSKPLKKEGKKGTYYSIIFTTKVWDTNGSKLFAVDHHDFFFKL
ncbi:MAG: hypothetical protein EU544_01095 [Promethearchaeota archaeon]|nr:MAG: hypothetical protein EU544_01095 [Candidatus Lokiarchaeota archaeon]